MEAGRIKDKEDLYMQIQYNGDLYFNIPMVLTNYCPILTDDFPFDSQLCTIVLSSWIYLSNELVLEHTGREHAIRNVRLKSPSFTYEKYGLEIVNQ